MYGNGHTTLCADMIRSVLTGKNPYVDAEAGRRPLEIILAIYKGRLTRLPVPLPLTDFALENMAGLFR